MSLSGLRRQQMEAERNITRLRNCLPDKLEAFCKLHMSILLDRSVKELEELFGESSSKRKTPIKKKVLTLFSKKKESPPQMGNRFPTQEQVAQIHQLSEFLQRPENIRTEGLFRITGNLARQRLLKEWVNSGSNLRLDDGLFSPHDCANVLKSCVADLPEPLLKKKNFAAYLQIVDMSKNVKQGDNGLNVQDQQIKALQLMFLLIPRENAILLECVLDLLHKVSNVPENRMSANSLGMVFAPGLICPKELTSLEFHSLSPVFTKAVSLMIASQPFLFKIPRELAVDVGTFWEEMEEPFSNVFSQESVPQHKQLHLSVQKTKHDSANALKQFKEIKCETSQEAQEAQQQTYSLRQATSQFSNKKKFIKQIITPASQTVTCPQTKHTPKLSIINDETWQVEMEQLEHKDIPNDMQQKHTAVVSPITQCIKVAPTSTKIAMMTPRSRKPISLQFPVRYVENDL
ncbi:hypothetical protein ACJMK2_005873 [Sinanodonta woodiana]|uniref:Rho-GAP domain-containing protein n=1 Tax=Sinanodonta woodiana TaxID=1069815 RepID=A0ABD3VRE8_SINWO